MNIAELSIKKKTVTLVMTVMALVFGLIAYQQLPRLEDPEFTIKEAVIYTSYPGGSAQEVEQEVSNEIEKACQQLGQLKKVRSTSMRGLSIVKPEIKDQYDKSSLPQVWDELRRKVNDAQGKLPPGTTPTIVNDDFGDVYGVFFAITGDGYSMAELKEVAKFLERELLLVQDVKKISIYGLQNEAVYVKMNREKMARFGIAPEDIYQQLAQKNLVADSGKVKVGNEYIPIAPTGGITSLDELGYLLLSKDSNRLVFLKDVAEIERGYVEPPTNILRYDGKPAVGLAISTVSGGNVVTMGEALEKRMEELMPQIPVGVNFGIIALQSKAVVESVNGFVVNLVEAVVIVIIVLLIFMGVKSGFLIGFILFLTICCTFFVMGMYDITLERISLGALIIALGMLVDNAIVVTEGIMIKVKQGVDGLKAAKDIVAQQIMPLLGATAIAVIAFAAIGLSQDGTGEYCRSLFYVLLISLFLSWVTAVTVTPLVCVMAFKPKKSSGATKAGDAEEDAYNGFIFRAYRNFLTFCIRFRWVTCLVMIGALVASALAFTLVEKSFFPSSTRPQFMIDVWAPYGTHIKSTEKLVADIEKHVKGMPHVESVASCVGQGAPRFLLTYAPENPDTGYAMLLVTVDDWTQIDDMVDKLQRHYDEEFPDATVNLRKFLLGPGEGGKIQLRYSGENYNDLRSVSEQCMNIMREDGNAKGIRSDWRQKVKAVRPIFSETQARRTGITYQDLSRTLMEGFQGLTIGVYREGDELLPIIARAEEKNRQNVKNIEDLQIWSPAAQKMIPVRQIVSGFDTVWEDPIIQRWNRRPTITVHCDAAEGNASVLLSRLRKKFDAMELPPGVTLEYGGEYEDSGDAQAALASSIPAFIVIMILIVVFLFNSIRKTLIIWLTVPLAVIGVTVGLLVFQQPFGFMALLGFLSLTGMLIKNAIVLIDEIGVQLAGGKEGFKAIVDSAVSRLRPVAMAALTTVLGMLPLLSDAFFVAMAVTIMCGLAFACVLTLIVVPVMYSIFFKFPYAK